MSLEEYAGAKRDVGAESGSGAATESRMAKVAASAVADQRQKDKGGRKQLRAPGELRIIVGGDLSVRSGGGRASAAILHAYSCYWFSSSELCRLSKEPTQGRPPSPKYVRSQCGSPQLSEVGH